MSDYSDRAARKNEEYLRACENYVQTLSDAEREDLLARGLLRWVRPKGKPARLVFSDLDDKAGDDVTRDDDAVTLFANTMAMAVEDDVPAAVDRLAHELQQRFGLTLLQAHQIEQWHREAVRREVDRETGEQLNRVIGFLLLADNVRLCVHALAHAARLAKLAGFPSLRASAKAIGVSVEAVRKVAWRWVELLKLPPLEGAKTAEARARYSHIATTDHWRNKKCQPSLPCPTSPA